MKIHITIHITIGIIRPKQLKSYTYPTKLSNDLLHYLVAEQWVTEIYIFIYFFPFLTLFESTWLFTRKSSADIFDIECIYCVRVWYTNLKNGNPTWQKMKWVDIFSKLCVSENLRSFQIFKACVEVNSSFFFTLLC